MGNTLSNSISNQISRLINNKISNVRKARVWRRVGAGVVLSAAAVMPGFALAQASGAEYQLSYSNSELDSVAAVQALHVRIRRVALAYCPDYGVTKNLRERASCISDVESDLVSQVNNPMLTKIHSGDTAMTIAGASR